MRMGNKHSTKEDDARKASSRNCSRKNHPTPEACPLANASELNRRQSIEATQPVQLTPYQKSILREAWQRISKKGASNIGGQIFRRMMSKNAEIKRLFQHVTGVEGVFGFGLAPIKVYRHHSVLFVKLLDSAIANLDDLRSFESECVEHGEKHGPYRRYGFSPDMWDVFGECMTESAREWEGWKKHRETLRAWTILVSFIVDRMRQGYENAIRKEAIMTQLSSAKHLPPETDHKRKESACSSNDHANENAKRKELRFQLSQVKSSTTAKTTAYRRKSVALDSKSPVILRSKSALDIHLQGKNDEYL